MVFDQGYESKFLNHNLVNKSLELKIEDPSIMAEHFIVEFN